MPVELEAPSGDVWREAPVLMQQMRRCRMEPWAGRRAKRALFGPNDNEETRRFVKEELAAVRAADQDKYNFDFENMAPLLGPYEWEAVSAGEVPAAYGLERLQRGLVVHRSARRLDFDAPPLEARVVTPEPRVAAPEAPALPRSSEISAPPVRCDNNKEASTSEAASAGATSSEAAARDQPRPARQTTMTDFWRSRKRPSAFTTYEGTKRLNAGSPTASPSASPSTTSPAGEGSP